VARISSEIENFFAGTRNRIERVFALLTGGKMLTLKLTFIFMNVNFKERSLTVTFMNVHFYER